MTMASIRNAGIAVILGGVLALSGSVAYADEGLDGGDDQTSVDVSDFDSEDVADDLGLPETISDETGNLVWSSAS
jgi:hypothetical protein